MILVYIPGLPLDLGRRLPRPSWAWWTLRAASWSTSAPVLRRLSTGHFPRPARRQGSRGEPTVPSNLPLVAVGAGLLWFGWFGFNAGGAYAADGLAAYAFTNTTIAGSIAMIVWMLLRLAL